LSPRSEILARSLGLQRVISDYARLGCLAATATEAVHVAPCLSLRQQITDRLLLASLEVSAAAALLDSEEERAEEAANVLAERERRRATRLTSIAIGVGAAGALAVGLTGREAYGIATGVAEAVIGVMLLRTGRKVRFAHPNNPLRDFRLGIRRGSVFPAAIWTYFDETPAEGNAAISIRQELLRAWEETHRFQNGRNPSKTSALIFGDGGAYNKDQLRLRADLIDQLEALVNRMNEALRTFLAELAAPNLTTP
jgi:hypothetical protein